MTNQTYSERILNILSTQEQKSGRTAVFTKSVAKQRFPKVTDIHGTVMRTARKMQKDSLLKRIGPGTFTLSAYGRKIAN